MSSPSKVCTNCAPIIFEYYQKGLAVQSELMRTRDELQKLNFNRQMGTLKDLSDADVSISPQGKYQLNSRISGKRPFNLNLTQKESSRLLDRQASLATTATIVRNSTPSGKFTEKVRRDHYDQQKRAKDAFASVNTILQPSMESVSPLERIKNFEDQVNKKVDTFKKKLREEVARSAIRPSVSREAPSRPKTSIKAHRFLEDDTKSAPKVSMFSPDMKKNMRTSPIQFKLTPRHDGKENIDKGSAISRAEWTVGTNKEHRGTTNTDRERTLLHTYEKNQKRELTSSIKKIKTNFAKELNMMRVETSPGPQDKKLNSPYFSPLKASDLMSPNGHLHLHVKSEEIKHNYANFIKPSSNPLLDSLMFSPRDHAPKGTPRNHHEEAQQWTDRSSRKNSVFKSNPSDSVLKRSSENSPPKDFIKRDKDFFRESKKDNIFHDGLHTSLGAPSFHHSQSFSKMGNKLFQK